MKRVLIIVLLVVTGSLAGCSNPQSTAKRPHRPTDSEPTVKKRDVSGEVARNLLLANLRQTVATSDAVVEAAPAQNGIPSDLQLRLEYLQDGRRHAFNYLKRFRGTNAANATKAVFDAQNVSQMAHTFVQTVRDDGDVRQAQRDYATAKAAVTTDVGALYKSLNHPRN